MSPTMLLAVSTARLLLLLLLVAPVSALAGTCPEPTGGCILNIPDPANVPADPYVYSDVTSEAAASCKPFAKAIRVYGLLMLSNTFGQDVPDNGLRWLAHAVTELFPRDAADQLGQKKILEAMYRFRAATPVFVGAMVDEMEPARDRVSLCDTITIAMDDANDNPSGQILEVYEHLLHVITDVGLHHAYPERWGISTTSELYAAMREAIDLKVYDVSDYAKIDDEGRFRVELQEFAFWALSTVQGVHAEHFKDDAPLHEREWALTSSAEVQAKLPKFWALHEATTAKWMGKVSNATMVQLGNLAPGGTSALTAPWPIPGLKQGSDGDKIPKGACNQIPETSCEGNTAEARTVGAAVLVAMLFVLLLHGVMF